MKRIMWEETRYWDIDDELMEWFTSVGIDTTDADSMAEAMEADDSTHKTERFWLEDDDD